MQKTFFAHALPADLKFEGGYTNDPDDSGGPTNYGITQAEYDSWREAEGLPTESVRNITMACVQHIYKARYWDALRLDDVAYPMDWILFDTAVNMGTGTAVLLLCRAMGLADQTDMTDSLVNNVNARCANVASAHVLKTAYLQERINRYRHIVMNHPKDAKFLDGWLNRVEELRAES